jgi:hypothetical protein
MDQTAKQQIVERLKQANNVLITVGMNPTVDELAASIGLTLLLNKMNKHATTVFSGAIPSTIEFLQPEKTIETNTNSLRDFIIALDKSKADKLRYKVEDDVVRIFITPYRTSLSEQDLEFSQGDFNVEAVVAIGVSKKEELDKAITAHGRILHDATVMTITKAGMEPSELGSINLHDDVTSSFCETVLSIGNDVQTGLLDGQIATSFLTGIVAETDRFKNPKTTPQVLSLSAQLMSAGANQQLIAEKLEEPLKIEQTEAPQPAAQSEPYAKEDGELSIEHNTEETTKEIHIDEHGNMAEKPGPKDESESEDEPEKPASSLRIESLKSPLSQDDQNVFMGSYAPPSLPTGSLNSTSMPGEESQSVDPLSEPQRQEPLLSHRSYIEPITKDKGSNTQGSQEPLASLTQPASSTPRIGELSEPIETPSAPVMSSTPTLVTESKAMSDTSTVIPAESRVDEEPLQTISDIEKAVESPHVNSSANDETSAATFPSTTTDTASSLELAPDYSAQLDSAGDAVEKTTVNSIEAPEPVQLLGSQPLGQQLNPQPQAPTDDDNSLASLLGNTDAAQHLQQEEATTPHEVPTPQAQESSENAPPPVPPPMMPQFFDSDGQQTNPFLNPSE